MSGADHSPTLAYCTRGSVVTKRCVDADVSVLPSCAVKPVPICTEYSVAARSLPPAAGLHARFCVSSQRQRQSGDGVIVTGTSLASRSMRSEEHTSELQSLMRISYAVFCLKKKNYR